MATSILTSLPTWLAGGTYDGNSGNDLRNSDVTASWLDTGILTGSSVGVWGGVTSGAALKVSAASGMNVSVGPGSFVVPNTASAIAGGYRSTLASSGTLAVAASDPANPRVDLVVAYVSDVGTSSSFGAVEIITGTPAASPVAPSAPANSVALAKVTVPANATSIVLGNIADVRTFTAAAGGIPIAPKTGTGALPAGYSGLMAYDPVSGSFYHMGASGPRQAKTLPFAPVHGLLSAAATFSNPSFGAIGSASVATDGNTDLKITASIGTLYQSAGTASGLILVEIMIMLDSSVIYLGNFPVETFGGGNCSGLTAITYTSAAAASTPSNGAHTITVLATANVTSANVFHVSGVVPPASNYLRIEPANL